jgi:hypothetical protein
MSLRSLGLGAIVVVWGVVSLLILAVPAVLGLFLGESRRDLHGDDWRGPRIDPRAPGPFPPPSGQQPIRRLEKR